MKLFKFILSVGLLVPTTQSAYAGAEGVGGGFLRYHNNVAEKLILEAKDRLILELGQTQESYFKTEFTPAINRDEIIAIVKNLKLSPTVLRTRANPNGTSDYLTMDFGIDASGNKYIEVLEPLYQIIDEACTPTCYYVDQLDLSRRLFHESLHLVGYANEDKAWVASAKYYEIHSDPIRAKKFEHLWAYVTKGVVSNETIVFRPEYSPSTEQVVFDLSKLPAQAIWTLQSGKTVVLTQHVFTNGPFPTFGYAKNPKDKSAGAFFTITDAAFDGYQDGLERKMYINPNGNFANMYRVDTAKNPSTFKRSFRME